MARKLPALLEIPTIGRFNSGYISVAEHENLVPFNIKRVYWTYSVPHEVQRGHHAHKDLEQLIFAVNGSIEMTLINQEGRTFDFLLDHPSKGLYIPPLHWRTIKFSDNAVLLCLASDVYKESDYIRDYDQFINL